MRINLVYMDALKGDFDRFLFLLFCFAFCCLQLLHCRGFAPVLVLLLARTTYLGDQLLALLLRSVGNSRYFVEGAPDGTALGRELEGVPCVDFHLRYCRFDVGIRFLDCAVRHKQDYCRLQHFQLVVHHHRASAGYFYFHRLLLEQEST